MRAFLLRFAAIVLACLPLAAIGATGAAFLAESARQSPGPQWLRVASVSELPSDGTPERLFVYEPHRDAWTRLPDRLIGSVYVRRQPNGQVVALHATHHAGFGIPILYDEQQRCFRSQWWPVGFDLDGRELQQADQALHGEDVEPLPVQVRDGEVFVRFTPPEPAFKTQR